MNPKNDQEIKDQEQYAEMMRDLPIHTEEDDLELEQAMRDADEAQEALDAADQKP
jgi:hypothetical protein